MAVIVPSQQAGFPQNVNLVDENGNLQGPWLYLFKQLWQKLGQQYSVPQTIVFGVQTGAKEVTFYQASTGASIGKVTLT